MARYCDLLNSYKGREFDLSVFQGRIILRNPRPDRCWIAKIIEAHEDYVIIENVHQNGVRIKYTVPIGMVYFECEQ